MDSLYGKEIQKEWLTSTPLMQVETLLGVVSGRLPMERAHEILSDDVACYMNGRKLSTTKAAWFRWVSYLHHSAGRKISDLDLIVQRMDVSDDMVMVDAFWQGVVDGQKKSSEPGQVLYRFDGGRIVEIQTHRSNYIFIYGGSIVSLPGFWWRVLRMMMWRG